MKVSVARPGRLRLSRELRRKLMRVRRRHGGVARGAEMLLVLPDADQGPLAVEYYRQHEESVYMPPERVGIDCFIDSKRARLYSSQAAGRRERIDRCLSAGTAALYASPALVVLAALWGV